MGNQKLGKDWALYEYDAPKGTYKTLKENDTLTQRKAYWLIQVFSAPKSPSTCKGLHLLGLPRFHS
jgi:hypothetical protein